MTKDNTKNSPIDDYDVQTNNGFNVFTHDHIHVMSIKCTKNGNCFYFRFCINFEDWIWVHRKWCTWKLNVENSLYQPLVFEFSFNNVFWYVRFKIEYRLLYETKNQNYFCFRLQNVKNQCYFKAWNELFFSVFRKFFSVDSGFYRSMCYLQEL